MSFLKKHDISAWDIIVGSALVAVVGLVAVGNWPGVKEWIFIVAGFSGSFLSLITSVLTSLFFWTSIGVVTLCIIFRDIKARQLHIIWLLDSIKKDIEDFRFTYDEDQR